MNSEQLRHVEIPTRLQFLGEPQVGIKLPEVEEINGQVIVNLPLDVVLAPKRLNGVKRGIRKTASVPLFIPESNTQKSSSLASKCELDRSSSAVEQKKMKAQRLANALLETQVRTVDGTTYIERASHFTHDTLSCLLHPQLEASMSQKFASTSADKNLPSLEQAKIDRLSRATQKQHALDTNKPKQEHAPQLSELERLSKVASLLVEAASVSQTEISAETRLKLMQLRKAFKCSDFSVKDLVGPDGVARHLQFIDDLDFVLSLDPLSPQRAALLELCDVYDELTVPGIHRLVRELAAYDIRQDAKNRDKHSSQREESLFFHQGTKTLTEKNRANIGMMRSRYTEIIRSAAREQRQKKSIDSDSTLATLMAFHEVECQKNSPYIAQQTQTIVQLSAKSIIDMSHEEIAFLLSVEFERSTRPNHSTADQDPVFAKVKELNEAGLYYFNMDFYSVHDPNTFHGAFVTLPNGSISFDWCPVHSPGLDLQLSNISFNPAIPSVPVVASVPVPSLPVVSEALSGGADIAQGMMLFATAFAVLGGTGMGVTFLGEGQGTQKRKQEDEKLSNFKRVERPQRVLQPKLVSRVSSEGAAVGRVLIDRKKTQATKLEHRANTIEPKRSFEVTNKSEKKLPKKVEKLKPVIREVKAKTVQVTTKPTSKNRESNIFAKPKVIEHKPVRSQPLEKPRKKLVQLSKERSIPIIVFPKIGKDQTPVSAHISSAPRKELQLRPVPQKKEVAIARPVTKERKSLVTIVVQSKREQQIALNPKPNEKKVNTSQGKSGHSVELPMHRIVIPTELSLTSKSRGVIYRSPVVRAITRTTRLTEKEVKSKAQPIKVEVGVSKKIEKVVTSKTEQLTSQKRSAHQTQRLVRHESKKTVSTVQAAKPREQTVTVTVTKTEKTAAPVTTQRIAVAEIKTDRAEKKVKTIEAQAEKKSTAVQKETPTPQKTTTETKVQKKQSSEATKKKEQQVATKTEVVPDINKESEGESWLAVATSLIIGKSIQTTLVSAESTSSIEAVASKKNIDTVVGSLALSTSENLVSAVLARKHTEYGQGRSGAGGATAKTKSTIAKPTLKTAPISKAATTEQMQQTRMQTLPTNRIVDVSDSFNMAREVKMWALEAVSHRQLIGRHNPRLRSEKV